MRNPWIISISVLHGTTLSFNIRREDLVQFRRTQWVFKHGRCKNSQLLIHTRVTRTHHKAREHGYTSATVGVWYKITIAHREECNSYQIQRVHQVREQPIMIATKKNDDEVYGTVKGRFLMACHCYRSVGWYWGGCPLHCSVTGWGMTSGALRPQLKNLISPLVLAELTQVQNVK